MLVLDGLSERGDLELLLDFFLDVQGGLGIAVKCEGLGLSSGGSGSCRDLHKQLK